MAAENTAATLAMTKKVYGEDLSKLKFELGIVGELLPFAEKAKLGDTYQYLMALANEHGFTYNGTSGSVVTLNDAIAGLAKQAAVSAYEYFGKARIASRIVHDAAASGPAAFGDATGTLLNNLMASAEYRQEHSLIYGQQALCKVSSNSSGVLTITDATWSAALVDGLEGAVLEAFDGLAASATQDNGDLTVTAVDLDAKTITVSGTSAAVDGNSYLWFKGTRTATAFNEMAGLWKLASTVTGTVNGIDVGAYSRARPNVKSSFGNPTVASFLSAVSKLTGRRVRKKELNLLLPVPAFDRIALDIQSNRRYDGAKKSAIAGYEAIELASSLGMTRFIPHPMLRDGDALAFTSKNGFRTGSKELGWEKGPTGDSADLWIPISTNNSYEVRVSAIEAPAFLRPHEVLSITGITYS